MRNFNPVIPAYAGSRALQEQAGSSGQASDFAHVRPLFSPKHPHMGFLDILLHLFGFAGPAIALALLMPLAGRFLMGRKALRRGYWPQAGLGLVVGLAVLLAGLWYFGHDGKMATYAALVVAVGTAQWLQSGGWRRT
jgi:hypothetical protein